MWVAVPIVLTLHTSMQLPSAVLLSGVSLQLPCELLPYFPAFQIQSLATCSFLLCNRPNFIYSDQTAQAEVEGGY